MRTVWIVLLSAACAHAGNTIVLSVRGLDCSDCAREFLPELEHQPGVRAASFDRVRSEVVIEAAPGVTPESLVAIIEHRGYQASIGPGHGAYQPPPDYPAGSDVAIASHGGRDVALESLPVAGKATVVDFYAEWCGPCHEVDRHLAQLLAARADVAVRKIDVRDWDSPVARHHLAGVREIPYQLVFDRRGRQVAAIVGYDLAKLDAAIAEAAR